jgi:riboflavin synthase
MFTGLIEAVGTVRRVVRRGAGARLEVQVEWPDPEAPSRGDSVAVNGACLTAVAPDAEGFAADLSSETLDRTLLGSLGSGEPVNLERAVRLGDRLGGHLVQGHVDTVVRLLEARNEGGFSRWRMSLPREVSAEVALKGSVALHGVSLTVSGLEQSWFEVALIPETLHQTTFGRLRVGSQLHLETDVIAKYIARRLGTPTGSALEEIFGPGSKNA